MRLKGNVAIRYGVVIAGAALMAFPLLYLVSGSLMSAQDVLASPPHLLPPSIHLDNFARAMDFLTARTIVNSFVFALSVVALQLLLGVPAGFALAKIPFRGTAALALLFVVPVLLPNNVSIIPTYLITRELGLLNSYPGMIIPIVGQTTFATLLFRQFYIDMPGELFEAARIDGASWFRMFISIAVPLAKPAVAAYASVSFLTAWNMYIWPLVVAPSEQFRVLSVALAPLAGTDLLRLVPPNVSLAALLISLVPVLAAFLLVQRWFVKGLTGTGLD